MSNRERLHIYDVSLRDGLQRHSPYLPIADKLKLYHALVGCGLRELEVTSFVSPKAIPQLADATQFYAQILADELTDYSATSLRAHSIRRDVLVINERGLTDALKAGARGISLVLVASESLSQRNSKIGVAEALERARSLILQIRQHHLLSDLTPHVPISIRAYIAAAWVCPYEGVIPLKRSAQMATQLLDWGVDEVALADTVGHATPPQVSELIERLKALGVAPSRLAVHLHDTLALGLVNAHAAIQSGVRRIDAALGGLGGCPFAPGAAGNLATEDLALLGARLGYDTGVDLEALHNTIELAEKLTQRSLGGRTRAWWRSRDLQAPLSQLDLPSDTTVVAGLG